MKVIKYNHLIHYAYLVDWCKLHKLPITPYNLLPRVGCVVTDGKDNNPICMGFLYQLDNTPMYWVEGITSNPHTDKEKRGEGLKILLEWCYNEGIRLGGELILGSSHHESLTGHFKNSGFSDSGRTYKHLGRGI
jgi:hypothetical protein